MSRLLPYLPSVVLLAWAAFVVVAGDALMPAWLVLLAASFVLMVLTLSRRYRHE